MWHFWKEILQRGNLTGVTVREKNSSQMRHFKNLWNLRNVKDLLKSDSLLEEWEKLKIKKNIHLLQ